MTDTFEHADAAYVMGALDPAEADEFEAHLRTCPACRARVDEARGTVTLLGAVSAADFLGPDLGESEPVPDTLLPGVLRRARRERSRRTIFTAGIAAVVAACLVAVAFLAWPSSDNSSQPSRQAFVAVQPTQVTASAHLAAKTWGTEIDLRCKYAESATSGHSYSLQVIDKAGAAVIAGSWALVPGKTISFTSGTSVQRNQIAEVKILRPDGAPILKLRPRTP